MFRFYAPIMFGLADGMIGAAEGALTAAVGATLLATAGYPCNVTEATKVGALGKSVLTAYIATRSKKLFNCGFFAKTRHKFFSFTNAFLSSSYLGLQIINGMVGCVIAQCLEAKTPNHEEMAKLMLLGSAVVLVPIWLIDTALYRKIFPFLSQSVHTLKILDAVENNEEYSSHSPIAMTRIEKIPRK